MNKFRAIGDLPRSSEKFEPESDNYRALQNLNDRKVLLVDTRIHFPHDGDQEETNTFNNPSNPSSPSSLSNPSSPSNTSSPSNQSSRSNSNERVTMLIDPEVIEASNTADNQSAAGKLEEKTADSKETTTAEQVKIKDETEFEKETTTATAAAEKEKTTTTTNAELNTTAGASLTLESTGSIGKKEDNTTTDIKTPETTTIDVKTKETTTPATAKLDDHAQAQLEHKDKGHSFASKSKSDIHMLILTIILISSFNFIY